MRIAVIVGFLFYVALAHQPLLDESGNVCVGSGPAVVPGCGLNLPALEWEVKTPMPTARMSAGCGVANDTLYVAGGYGSGGRLAVTEAYDPTGDAWTTVAVMPTARNGVSATSAGGRFYVIAGYNGNYLRTVEAYDPGADSWETMPSLSIGRTTPAAVTFDDCIYVIGGYTGSSYPRTVERFDPVAGTWDTVAPLPTGRTGLTAAVIAGKIVAIGGWTGSEPPLNTVEVYDPVADSWSTAASMPTSRWNMASTVMDSWVFVFGGALTFSGTYTDIVEAYDPAADQWSVSTSMLVPRKTHVAGAIQGRSYIVGGYNGQFLNLNHQARVVTSPVAEGVGVGDRPGLEIGPNPCTGMLRVSSSRAIESAIVFDAQGRRVAESAPGHGRAEIRLELSGQVSGVYFVCVRTEEGTWTRKVVLER